MKGHRLTVPRQARRRSPQGKIGPYADQLYSTRLMSKLFAEKFACILITLIFEGTAAKVPLSLTLTIFSYLIKIQSYFN